MKGVRVAIAVAALAGSALSLVGCGGSDSSVASRDDLTKLFVDSAKSEGVVVDETCVGEAVAQIPEADFQILVDNMEGIMKDSVNMDELNLSEDALNAFVAVFACQVGS